MKRIHDLLIIGLWTGVLLIIGLWTGVTGERDKVKQAQIQLSASPASKDFRIIDKDTGQVVGGFGFGPDSNQKEIIVRVTR